MKAFSYTFMLLGMTAVFASGVNMQPFSPAATRKAFLNLIDRPRVPLAPELSKREGSVGGEHWHFSFAADAEQRVPGILVKASNFSGRRPVVISLHGTGGTKESQLDLLNELASLGFIGVAIDGRYHGERIKAGKGAVEYNQAMLRTYRTGKEHPFLYDTVWDVMRLLDYLLTRPDVDANRIALIGFSKGGMETYLTAAVDARVAAAVPFIGVQSFRWALEHDSWQSRVGTFQDAIQRAAKDEGEAEIKADFVYRFYQRVMPGIADEFDGPQMVPLIAPRPLLVINGDTDPRTPMPGLMDCIEKTRAAYKEAKAEGNFEVKIQSKTGHAVTPEARKLAISWLQKWLHP
ncbi:MAG: acetylxylan esterase [Acidobacteria bacterium]|nr:acetylxylan esterase [Acidobacteriota bacterium]